MAVPATPVYLPGGLAPVRTVGGDPYFITDFAECCCDCMSDARCVSHCAPMYAIDVTTGDCSGNDCDDLYVLEWDVWPGHCLWADSGGEGNVCTAWLFCVWSVDAGHIVWRVNVYFNNVFCTYERYYDGACPEGIYHLAAPQPPYTECTNCEATLEVGIYTTTTTTEEPTTTTAAPTTTTP